MRLARLAAARIASWMALIASLRLRTRGVGSPSDGPGRRFPPRVPSVIGIRMSTLNFSTADRMSSWISGRKSGTSSSMICRSARNSISMKPKASPSVSPGAIALYSSIIAV